MEESTRWLILTKREEEAIQNLKRAFRWHKIKIKEDDLRKRVIDYQASQVSEFACFINISWNL